MSKRDDLIAKYAADMKEKLGVTPDMELLTKVVIGCGPSIYNADGETVAASDKAELERIRTNYLVKKLGLPDGPELSAAIDEVVAQYGSANRNKYRAVVYYQLCTHFGKQSAYA
ncbi:DUF2853 family protein [Paracoccus sp. PS-1]|uniref:DUF2853 family protein n=1 Tax=unclassified Paracoccus (in: a-proteobacteria) TaxID=2688777 RepID=UPI00049134FE|nr:MULTISPECIES: DUF2853 family protein [unclassified Paracoccus (in: a-proteobacteria)]MDQ7260753.1 DUF2853 family protein [Paracoccus sp. PS1]RQP06131.1 MAG: DUF2853 family protein [Paracoccus sp. BP8]UFM65720.1 DUF2853 family protein [Paracoccus sp. MA]